MLQDVNVMLVEDEILIAMDMADQLEEQGARVVGPFADLDAAMARFAEADVAVLDVDVRGRKVFPLADALAARGTPILFHTGGVDASDLRARYGEAAQILPKPSAPGAVAQRVHSLI